MKQKIEKINMCYNDGCMYEGYEETCPFCGSAMYLLEQIYKRVGSDETDYKTDIICLEMKIEDMQKAKKMAEAFEDAGYSEEIELAADTFKNAISSELPDYETVLLEKKWNEKKKWEFVDEIYHGPEPVFSPDYD